MRQKGKITKWNDDKGFGFITPIGSDKQVFVHIKSFKNRSSRPELNQTVWYDISKDSQGRVCAANTKRSSDRKEKRGSHRSTFPALFLTLFLLTLAISVLIFNLPIWIPTFYLVVSLLTFVVYFFDKLAAKKGGWRTPEKTLHLLALTCGWPGAVIAQQLLRHKSKKHSFQVLFWITIVINVLVYIGILTPTGVDLLRSLGIA